MDGFFDLLLDLVGDMAPVFETWRREDSASYRALTLGAAAFWGLLGVVCMLGGLIGIREKSGNKASAPVRVAQVAAGVLMLAVGVFFLLAPESVFAEFNENLPSLLAIGMAGLVGGYFGWSGLTEKPAATEEGAPLKDMRGASIIVSVLLFAYAALVAWFSFAGGRQVVCGVEWSFLQTTLCSD